MEQKENRVVLRGTVAGEAVLSHQVHGIDFYRFPLAVPRLSGREDLLNILFPLSSPETALPHESATKLAGIYSSALSKDDCIKAYNYLQTLKAK